MKLHLAGLMLAAATVPTTAALAQMSGSTEGRYATHSISEDVQELEDGSSIVLFHYHQTAFADDANHPIDNTSASCIGRLKTDAGGMPVSSNGSCFSADADGDGASFWWRMTEVGTEQCPDMCGVWGYYAGDGKFAGIEGEGTWQRTTLFPDASSGVWTGSYSIP
jgi:hypothetical protein